MDTPLQRRIFYARNFSCPPALKDVREKLMNKEKSSLDCVDDELIKL